MRHRLQYSPLPADEQFVARLDNSIRAITWELSYLCKMHEYSYDASNSLFKSNDSYFTNQ